MQLQDLAHQLHRRSGDDRRLPRYRHGRPAHGAFSKYNRIQVRWDGTHPKIVCHKGGGGTHAFRLANTNWQFPRLVGWKGYPAGLRDALSNANFDSAVFGLKDSSFNSHLAAATPSDISFDPWA